MSEHLESNLPPEEPYPHSVELALDLLKLGVSSAGVSDLLARHDHAVIERQLAYLPYRKAKRPEAFIIEAIRKDYSPPKEFFYAPDPTLANLEGDTVDQDSQ